MKVSSENVQIRLNDAVYMLAAGQDVELLEERFVQAVRDGGAFVSFLAAGDIPVSVLVGPALTVAFEARPDLDDEPMGGVQPGLFGMTFG